MKFSYNILKLNLKKKKKIYFSINIKLIPAQKFINLEYLKLLSN